VHGVPEQVLEEAGPRRLVDQPRGAREQEEDPDDGEPDAAVHGQTVAWQRTADKVLTGRFVSHQLTRTVRGLRDRGRGRAAGRGQQAADSGTGADPDPAARSPRPDPVTRFPRRDRRPIENGHRHSNLTVGDRAGLDSEGCQAPLCRLTLGMPQGRQGSFTANTLGPAYRLSDRPPINPESPSDLSLGQSQLLQAEGPAAIR